MEFGQLPIFVERNQDVARCGVEISFFGAVSRTFVKGEFFLEETDEKAGSAVKKVFKKVGRLVAGFNLKAVESLVVSEINCSEPFRDVAVWGQFLQENPVGFASIEAEGG